MVPRQLDATQDAEVGRAKRVEVAGDGVVPILDAAASAVRGTEEGVEAEHGACRVNVRENEVATGCQNARARFHRPRRARAREGWCEGGVEPLAPQRR